MAPMTASNTARAGGILFPITLNVARVFGSEPGPTASRIGSFLLLALYHGDLVVSAMFLTACAPNPLVAEFVRQGSAVRLSWTTWAVAASVPGVVALAAIPYLVYRLSPPIDLDTGAARTLASERLAEMGPLSGRERGMLIVFCAGAGAVDRRRLARDLADHRGAARRGRAAARAACSTGVTSSKRRAAGTSSSGSAA